MSKIEIFVLNKNNITKNEFNIIKPKTYTELLKSLSQKFNNIEYYEIFIFDQNNNIIIINNEEKYQTIEDILFIREIDKDILEQSLFQINYDKLSESKQEILDEQYNCLLCSVKIKKEKPYFCYKCQKIFHEKCLKDWDNKCKLQNKKLICPNCRNELPIEQWNKKLNYEDNRKVDANLINQVNELKDNEIIHYEIIKKYEKYIEKTIQIFKDILDQINSLHKLLNLENNYELNNLINAYPLSIHNLDIDGISNMIKEELNKFINHIYNNSQINLSQNSNQINPINDLDEEDFNIIHEENKMDLDEDINIKQNIILNENDKIISLKYFAKSKGIYDILGEKFIDNNVNNIQLIINDKKSNLTNKAELKKGENIIKLIITNKITNFSHMFHLCKSLKNIDDLKYLDVSESKDFSYMFYKCSSLSDINALKNWDVSNSINFEYMFYECSLISDIEPLKYWKVFNGKDFGSMFYDCSSLLNISPLKDWDVSNCEYFSNMFRGCSSLTNIKALEKWNVSKCKDFTSFFSGCCLLSDISSLKKWDVSKCNSFQGMFFGCSSLSDIKPLKNWNVSNCMYFINMFYGCTSLSNIKPLHNWNITKDKRKTNMLFGCPLKYV